MQHSKMYSMRAQLCLLFILLLQGCALFSVSRHHRVSVMQGLTSEESVEFNILTDNHFTGTIKVKDNKCDYYSPVISDKTTLEDDGKSVYQVVFKLPPHLIDNQLELILMQRS